MNFYTYANNNPINFNDPGGLEAIAFLAGQINSGSAYPTASFGQQLGIGIFNLNPRVDSDFERALIGQYFIEVIEPKERFVPGTS